ncbi:MAG: efflux RND transporter permease subunit [Eubacteriales bacterium]
MERTERSLNRKEKLFRGIVKHKKLVIGLFLISCLVSGICRQFVGVNYDMNSYLPEDTASTVSLEMMDEEFGSGIPNARVMISNVTIPQALQMKEEIESIVGVTEVTWLDDTVDITVPIETIDSNTTKNYYKDENALFSVTVCSEKRLEAVNAIRDLIGNDNAMTGEAVDTATATQSTTREIGKIVLIAIPFVLFILFITTTSWFEPILLLCSIGIAILINTGSNIIFGEISFVTNAAQNILQLAVSLDYSVFLLHRFKEEREKTTDVKEAMIFALCKSTSSILSSGLTTVIGFLALTLMKFQIGPDMGFALAKGIALSLITVFALTPVLTLYFYKLIDKSTHRSFMPKFEKFGRFINRMMIPLTVFFVIMIVPSFLASTSNDYYYGSSKMFNETTKLGQYKTKIEDVFGKSNNYVLMVPQGDFATEAELSTALKSVSQVSSIISYVDNAGAEVPMEYVDEDILSMLISENYSRMIISVKTDYEGTEAFSVVERIRDIAEEYYPDGYYLAGESVSTYDLKTTVTSDMVRVNIVAIAAVFIVLLLSMKSIMLPVILVAAIETAIWLNLSIPYYTGTPLFYLGYLIISSIQLGATVDYAILLTDRYLELRQTYRKKEAISQTVTSVTTSILTSGIVLTAVGFFLGKMTTHGLLSQLGYLLGRGTICSLVIVFFVVPGLLYIFDGFIQSTTKGVIFVIKKIEEEENNVDR